MGAAEVVVPVGRRELSNAAFLRMIRHCEVAAACAGCDPERGEGPGRRRACAIPRFLAAAEMSAL